MRQNRGWRVAGGALAASVALATLVVAAEQESYSAFNGSRTFRTYCANCHGVDASGDGYIADTLRKKPTDLTRLAANNGGVFPAERVQAVIDGLEEVRTHGKRDMPVWGDVFLWPEGDSAERREVVKRKIGELVEHLRMIQAPANP